VSVEKELFELFPHGLLVFSEAGDLLASNPRAGTLLGSAPDPGALGPGRDCCALLACGKAGTPLEDACVTELAAGRGASLPEIRIDVEGGAVWVVAAPLGDERIVVELRPGEPGDRRRRTEPHWMAGKRLSVQTLGRTQVESAEGSIGGRWLESRAGQIFKYLVCKRHRLVHTDEIAEHIWNESDISTRNTVRHFVHALRDRLEPDRTKRAESSFVVSRQGGYALMRDRITVDADIFEQRVDDGLAVLDRSPGEAAALLREAIDLYRGEFLEDEPYADWALPERDRLREVASDALRTLVRLAVDAGELEEAWRHGQRLAELQPFDGNVERQAIALCLARGRRTDALRRYVAFRERIQRKFGEPPEFGLNDVRGDELLRIS
jgi:DNA-binding SARP family transcriptional activator